MSLQSRVVHLDNAKHRGVVRELDDIRLITMHCTASGKAQSAKDVIRWMNGQPNPISYHYLIGRDGTMYRMTKPDVVAYHAGDSAWPNPRRATPDNPKPHKGASINKKSLGIAWVNDNQGERLTALQVESAEWLCHFWMRKLGLAPSNVIGHNECSPGRKVDPARAMEMKEWRAMLADNVPIHL